MPTKPKRHPLRGAWAKYDQAVEHSERYKTLFKDFIANNSFAIIGLAQPGEETATLGPDDVWPELSCAMGDAIHNLRSALDHIAYAVALDRLPEEQIGRLYFTIRPTLGKFKKAFREEPLSLMGADWEAFVLSIQPFQGVPYADIARISELDNLDKHCLMFNLTPRSDVHSRQQDQQSPRYVGAVKAAKTVAQRFPDVETYVQKSTREKSVRQMVGDSKDQDAIREYAFHYRRLSQTPHGTILGMLDVLDFRSDGNIGIRFDSRLDDPNFAIQTMTIYLITFLELVDKVFSLGRSNEIKDLQDASEATLARLWPEAYRREHRRDGACLPRKELRAKSSSSNSFLLESDDG